MVRALEKERRKQPMLKVWLSSELKPPWRWER